MNLDFNRSQNVSEMLHNHEDYGTNRHNGKMSGEGVVMSEVSPAEENPGCKFDAARHLDLMRQSMNSGMTKENDLEVRSKLQSIQSGKAFLEKKIQEYEARLQEMKMKKNKSKPTTGLLSPSTDDQKPKFRF